MHLLERGRKAQKAILILVALSKRNMICLLFKAVGFKVENGGGLGGGDRESSATLGLASLVLGYARFNPQDLKLLGIPVDHLAPWGILDGTSRS